MPDIMKPMAQRSRIQVDAGPAMLFAVTAEAGQQSIDQKRRITQRELVLIALKKTYPRLADAVDNELANPQPTSVLDKLTGGQL